MTIQEFTDANYLHEIQNYQGYVLIDFWAPWCGPCKAFSPIIEEYALEAGDEVKVGKMNVDENPDTPSKFGVRSIPTLVLLKNGKQVASKVGALQKDALASWVESIIK